MFSMSDIIADAHPKPPRILILGIEKIGKTEFAAGVCRDNKGNIIEVGRNNPIFMPIAGEEGVDNLDVPKFPTLATFDGIMDAINMLYSEDHPYQTAVLDSASAAQSLINQKVCDDYDVDNVKKVKGFRVGEAAIEKHWENILSGLTALRDEKNMSSIIIGHVRVAKARDPLEEPYDAYHFDVDQPISEKIRRWADVILFATRKYGIKHDDVGFGQKQTRAIDFGAARVLWTQGTATHPGGGRGVYGRLPTEIKLDWGVFEQAVADAHSKTTKKED